MADDAGEFDYSADTAKPLIGDNLKKSLINSADQLEQLEAEIAELQSKIDTKTAALKVLTDTTIPGLMDGMTGALALDDGRVLEVTEKIRASIAGEKAGPAVKWLDEHDHSSIVKRQFVIEFNRDDEAWAKKFEADLRKRKKPLNVVRKHTVHPQTLEAFVREQFALGVELPKETFGIYRQRIAKVTRPDVNSKPRRSKKDKSDIADF